MSSVASPHAVLPLVVADISTRAPGDVWRSWSWEPAVLVGVVLSAWLYARGLRSSPDGRPRVPAWRAAAFYLGLLAVLGATTSPLDALGSVLFSGHMAQHLLLTVVAAPLVVLGVPLVPIAGALPAGPRRALRRFERALMGAGRPRRRARLILLWWAVYVATFWVWHLPPLYEAALHDEAVHAGQHATYFVSALAFWWSVAGPHRHRTAGLGVGVCVATLLQGAWGGSLFFAFAERSHYPTYRETAPEWGLTAVEDIQLGGAVMAAGGIVYLATAFALVAIWMGRGEAREAGRPGSRRAGPPASVGETAPGAPAAPS